MNPNHTSTPTTGFKLFSRRSIHDSSYPSPININKDTKSLDMKLEVGEYKDESDYEEEDEGDYEEEDAGDYEEEDEGDYEEEEESEDGEEENITTRNQKAPSQTLKENLIKFVSDSFNNWLQYVNVSITVGALVLVIMLFFPIIQETKRDDRNGEINNLIHLYSQKYPDLWHYVKSSIREVMKFNKPSVILFLYLQNQEKRTNKLILLISQFAKNHLNRNNLEPLIINGSELNTNLYLNDYGNLLEDYRNILEERNVLVVQNLEMVSTNVSQAFHSLCDEFNPLVKRSFIVFTVKVDKFIGKEFEQAGIILKNAWGDLDGDKLEPLVARVTSMVLRINSE